MTITNFMRGFREYRRQNPAPDQLLAPIFAVVLLALPMLIYAIDLFALIYLVFVILPFFYAVINGSVAIKPTRPVERIRFYLLFLRGTAPKIRKTFQAGKTLLIGLAVLLISQIVTNVGAYFIAQATAPRVIEVLLQLFDELMIASQNSGDLTAFVALAEQNETLLFPYFTAVAVIPQLLAGGYIALRIYHRAFFIGYSKHFIVLDGNKLPPDIEQAYRIFRPTHRQVTLLSSLIPLLLFILGFALGSWITFTYIRPDARLIMMIGGLIGILFCAPMMGLMFQVIRYTYQLFYQANKPLIQDSYRQQVVEVLKQSELNPEDRIILERYLAKIEEPPSDDSPVDEEVESK